MAINLNSTPYYDDFSSDKNFHQILFRPGYAVQARELTQLQSILRNQISEFGGHVFKHGSVVIPGNSNSDLNICYVKLQATTYDVTTLEGKYVTGASTGLIGLIRKGIAATITDPDTIYVSYTNTGSSGQKVFNNGETLNVAGVATPFTSAASAATGGASMAFVSRGVFFVNGTFVEVLPQSIVIGKYTSTPSCHVLLKINEEIIDSDTDQTLLDPAQGSYNYSAPGADRLKISLTLTTLDLSATISDNYIELMRYDSGTLLEHLRYPKYNELEKSLARRTYDESGDYVVNGLSVSAREHLKSGLNNGRYDSPTGVVSKMIYTVDAGKAYIRGFENEVYSPVELIVNKARGADHLLNTQVNIVPSYGQYFYVTNLINLPDFKNREQITLYNASTGGSSIGTARVLAIDYLESNTTDSNAVFKLFVYDVNVTGGNDTSDIGRVTFTGGSFTVLSKLTVIPSNTTDFILAETVSASGRTATVHKYTRASGVLYLHKHSTSEAPIIGDIVTGGSGAIARVNDIDSLGRNTNNNLLVALPTANTYRVKTATNTSDMSYKLYYEATVSISGGTGSFSVTGMTIDPIEQGNFLITSAAGVHPNSTATVAVDGLSVSFTGISPASTTIKVVCAATKINSNANQKTKTFTSAYSQSGLSPASTVTLAKADGIRLISVNSSVDGDVTSRFDFDNGQTDYAYLRSSISLKSGETLPTGTLEVIYDYFEHNAGSGDFFSVDSYEFSGLSNYYDSTALVYKSKNTGLSYDLKNTLDFRSRVGIDGTFTGAGALTSNIVQIDSRITSSVQKYIGRIDAVVYSKDGTLSVINGRPAEIPKNPFVPLESINLAFVYVPPYTKTASLVSVRKQKNRVYTMKDVGKLESRVSNLEQYVMLSQAETDIVNYDIVDAKTGLSRFKSGYLVDTFNNPNSIADVYSNSFKVSYASGEIIPQFEVIEAPLTLVTSEGQTTGSVVTMPYTSVVMAQQPVSSRITNINPFAVFSWSGRMTLTPSTDTWTDIENLPVIVNNEIETRTETVTIRRPWNWNGVTNVPFEPAPTVVNTLFVEPPGGADRSSGLSVGGFSGKPGESNMANAAAGLSGGVEGVGPPSGGKPGESNMANAEANIGAGEGVSPSGAAGTDGLGFGFQ